MSAARRWVLATGNRGKLAELRSLLGDAGLDLEVVSQTELGIGPAAEDGVTTVDNAAERARREIGRPSKADVYRAVLVQALTEQPDVKSIELLTVSVPPVPLVSTTTSPALSTK